MGGQEYHLLANLHCGSCEATARKALMAIEGIVDVKASAKDGTVVAIAESCLGCKDECKCCRCPPPCTCDPCRCCTCGTEALVKALDEVGIKASFPASGKKNASSFGEVPMVSVVGVGAVAFAAGLLVGKMTFGSKK
jgi:hypothetical protein